MIITEKMNKGFTDNRSEIICKSLSSLIKDIPGKCWIAGGAIVTSYIDKEVRDIDLYFPCGDDFNLAKDYLISKGGKKLKDSNASMSIELNGNTFDLVRIFYDNPKKTIVDFDFIICCVAICKGGNLYYNNNFFKHLNEKILVFNRKCDMIGNLKSTLLRVNKYGVKGFNLSEKDADKLIKFHEENMSNKISEKYKKISTTYASASVSHNVFSFGSTSTSGVITPVFYPTVTGI